MDTVPLNKMSTCLLSIGNTNALLCTGADKKAIGSYKKAIHNPIFDFDTCRGHNTTTPGYMCDRIHIEKSKNWSGGFAKEFFFVLRIGDSTFKL